MLSFLEKLQKSERILWVDEMDGWVHIHKYVKLIK